MSLCVVAVLDTYPRGNPHDMGEGNPGSWSRRRYLGPHLEYAATSLRGRHECKRDWDTRFQGLMGPALVNGCRITLLLGRQASCGCAALRGRVRPRNAPLSPRLSAGGVSGHLLHPVVCCNPHSPAGSPHLVWEQHGVRGGVEFHSGQPRTDFAPGTAGENKQRSLCTHEGENNVGKGRSARHALKVIKRSPCATKYFSPG
ncbi:hypothetical protein NDU88_007044 [Pleurodeles waltl]|uniref:Uncharacterized protein n=1 Tax=Pleurodeles waltl TaxID=8319 RepID=A0AAV7MLT7_PLEWA|nr:hypothetical protein NDU88_007044 [Pleurodeles waltl]